MVLFGFYMDYNSKKHPITLFSCVCSLFCLETDTAIVSDLWHQGSYPEWGPWLAPATSENQTGLSKCLLIILNNKRINYKSIV